MLSACQNKTGVSFVQAGTSGKIGCSVTGPAFCKVGSTITYSCSVTNAGNLCFSKGCNIYILGGYTTCPSLQPGGSYSFTTNYTVKLTDFNWFSSPLKCNVTAYGCPPSGAVVTNTSSCSTTITLF